MTAGRINATLTERRYKYELSHRCRRVSKWRSFHALERARPSPAACPTRPGPTLFRPTNFRKGDTARFDPQFRREFFRSRCIAHPKRTAMFAPAAETGVTRFSL